MSDPAAFKGPLRVNSSEQLEWLSSSGWKVVTYDVGTGANNVVALDSNARLPALDGRNLTNLPASGNLPASAITSGVIAPARLGGGNPSSATVLTGAGWVGLTPGGNTIAATTSLLAGDGAGNAVGVTLWNAQPTRDFAFGALLSRSSADRSGRYLLERLVTLAVDGVNGSNANAGTLYLPKQTLASLSA